LSQDFVMGSRWSAYPFTTTSLTDLRLLPSTQSLAICGLHIILAAMRSKRGNITGRKADCADRFSSLTLDPWAP